MKNKISIKEIAKRAGVTPSTVSGVINGKAKERRISTKVVEQVEMLAKEFGYRPNPMAVSLRTGKSQTIGLIVEDISNTFFAKLAKTIEDEAYTLGYKIVYCSTENNDEKGNELIEMLLHQHVDGFLITPSKGMANQVKELKTRKKPVVLMDRYFPDVDVPSVLVQNYEGVREGVEHLIKKNYRNIAFVTVDLDQVQMHQREQAYLDAVQRHGLTYTNVLRLRYDELKETAVKLIGDFLRCHPKTDAVFFATNYLGVYGLESVSNMGLSIPDQLAVLCFDDHDIFRMFKPGISVISQPIEEIAKTAISVLLAAINGVPVRNDDEQLTKKTKLVIRHST